MLDQLRTYQTAALASIARQSTIVVLPTGSGKTLIAAKAAERSCLETKLPALFLVPTQHLVDQQRHALERDTSLRVARFRGGLAAPHIKCFDALVATPAAIVNMSQWYSLSSFGLVIFDEVHHVVKKHPHRQVALMLQVWLMCPLPFPALGFVHMC